MPIHIDSRGAGEQELALLLRNRNMIVSTECLKSGDIAFGDVGIERKTISDLIGSVSKSFKFHFWKQLEVLKDTYKYPFVLVEGEIDYSDRLVAGIIFSILLGWHVPIIPTKDIDDSANAIRSLFFKYGKEKSNRQLPAPVIKAKTPAQIKWAMLQCVQGVGPRTASVILGRTDLFSHKKEAKRDLTSLRIPTNSRAMLKAVFGLE